VKTKILFEIFHELQRRIHSIDSLHAYLVKSDYSVGKRSIYRYIDELYEALNPALYQLESEVGSDKVKWFSIKPVEARELIATSEWIEIFMVLSQFKDLFLTRLEKKQTVERLIDLLIANGPVKAGVLVRKWLANDMIEVSNFGEVLLTPELKKNIYKFLNYHQEASTFQITAYAFDLAHNKQVPPLHDALFPVRLHYHRGNYVFEVYSIALNQIFNLEVDMVKGLKLADQNIGKYERRESPKKELFGYHKSIIDQTRLVVLKFPPTPGFHVKNRLWSKNQEIQELEDGSVILKFKTEINIELLGWIMMWLDNVQILEPKELKTLYSNHLDRMTQINQSLLNPINNG